MQIFYFTRTGNSKKVAEEIANAKGIVANSISDGKDWSGRINFLKAGRSAAKRESLDVEHAEIERDGKIIVVFPVWANKLPPAIRGFMKKNNGTKVIAVALSASSSLNEIDQNNFTKVYEVKGKNVQAPKKLLSSNIEN